MKFRGPKALSDKIKKNPLLYVLLGALLFLYLEVFILPAIPLVAFGDQSIFLLDATRMLEGQVIYRDFFQFTLPGTESVYFGLFKLFGVRAWVPDAMLVLLGISLTWLSIVISKKLMSGLAVFLPGLLFLTFAFRSALDGTHHWYSTLAVIAALAVVLEKRSMPRVALAGALCGLSASFTQSQGAACAVGLALFLAWEGHRKRQAWRALFKSEGYLFLPFLAAFLAVNAYFVWKAGLTRFIYCTVVFSVKYYPSDWFNTWRVYLAERPSIYHASNWFELGVYLSIYALLPLVYVLFFVRYWRGAATQKLQPWDRLMLVNFVGVFMFLSIAPFPSYLRMCAVSLPAFILLVWLLNLSGKSHWTLRRPLWIAVLLLFVVEPVVKQTQWHAYLDVPTGRTAFLRRVMYEKSRWIFQRTRPGDFFFGDQLVSFALGLRDPAEVDFIRPTNYTRPEQVRNLVEALEKNRVQYVMWYRGLGSSTPRSLAGNHLAPLQKCLRDHYHLAKTFPDLDEVWQRNNLH